MSKVKSIPKTEKIGRPLAPWTYTNQEVFDLEYETLFLSKWQLVGHVNDVPGIGDYMTLNIGRDSVVVIRGKDHELRAFLNVCRHRASRIFEASGTCNGVIRCPYHGWTYRFDGTLMAIPQEETFTDFDKNRFGLNKVQIEVFHGMVFVRIQGDGLSVAEHFAHTAHFFEDYGVAHYQKIAEPIVEIWDANWKVAWDNYQENYHIPIGHPGLYRLVEENDEWDELTSGVNFGVFVIRNKLSNVENERRYQELLHHADQRVPDHLKRKWVQFGMSPNLGIDLYAEVLDFFQLIPLGPNRTMVTLTFYGHQNPTPEEEELRELNMSINDSVNAEDKALCARVQLGIQTYGYEPGPLSSHEGSLFQSHEMIRALIPVTSLKKPPTEDSVRATNEKMLQEHQ